MLGVFMGILCWILSFSVLVAADNSTDVPLKNKEPSLKDYDWSVWCKFQPNSFDCGKGAQSRFYYDTKMEDCKAFSFGGCPTNFNNFGTLASCHEICRDPGQHPIKYNVTDKVSCRLQPDFGLCDEYYPMWYFDINLRNCRGFSYSGCGGNSNRFPNAQICTAVCAAITQF